MNLFLASMPVVLCSVVAAAAAVVVVAAAAALSHVVEKLGFGVGASTVADSSFWSQVARQLKKRISIH